MSGDVWVLIPLVAIGAGVVKRWLTVKERNFDRYNSQAEDRAERYMAHTERLEQRMRVLERIVTDKGIDVADEIEALRDRQLADRRPTQDR